MDGKILGVTADSREVKPGFIFVAVKGLNVDGHDFVPDAMERGAVKIYGERDLKYPNYIKVSDSKEALGKLASDFYGNPSSKLKVIGVTGTKGKTTTSHIIHHILTELGQKTGLVSSITTQGFHTTTPDVVSLNRELADLASRKYKFAVIEVSSHGIVQGRLAGIKFEAAVLTHIAPEHLDYHKTFTEYKRVKMDFLKSAKIKVVSEKTAKLNILEGEFNNINAQSAIKVVKELGFDEKAAIKTLKTFELPEGRLEKIINNLGIEIFIDFAHTPDSLEASLKHLRSVTKGRLISVFGCAGERDHRKRRKMGKISFDLADLSIFTAEDPRSENLTDIFYQMRRNLPKESEKYICIPERIEAISYAIDNARKGDVIGFFGKGHEKSMAFKGFEHPWSDKEVIENYLKRNQKISAIILAAGKGTRMKAFKPKVVHEICGRPLISYTVSNLRRAKVGEIITVVSFREKMIIDKIRGVIKFAHQRNPKGGTGDAATSGLKEITNNISTVLIINGDDSAFYKPQTFTDIINQHIKANAAITFVTLIKQDPKGLGRIVRNKIGDVAGIVEEKDASEKIKRIKEVNDGLYIFNREWLEKNIINLTKGPQGEFYLTDLVKMAIDMGEKILTYKLPNDNEWHGINDQEQLREANDKMARILTNA